MQKGQRKVKPEFWIILVIVAIIAFALIADWWKNNAILGWTIVTIIIVILAFSIYRFPGFRGLFFKTTKKAGESIIFEKAVSEREPIPNYTRKEILQRAGNKCENPDCKSSVPPHIHHIDNNNSNNSPKNLIALCPNCHYSAHRNEMTNSQLRNWVQRSWESFKRDKRKYNR